MCDNSPSPTNDRKIPWERFQSNPVISRFLDYIRKEKMFSLSNIKRGVHNYWWEAGEREQQIGMSKPNGLNVREMFDAHLFQSGSVPLSDGDHELRIEAMDAHHIAACSDCSPSGTVLESCYFYRMRKCITHGWSPPISIHDITPAYHTDGNYPSINLFRQSADKEFQKMVKFGVVAKAGLEAQGVTSPMGALIKSSDKNKARALTGIQIQDQTTLSQVNLKLATLGLNELKARLTNDLTASGVNRAAYTPPFRYPNIADGLRIIQRDCYLAKGDVSRYFHQFPIAYAVRWIFMLVYAGVRYCLTRCGFGFSPCPYYCSTWAAEFRMWMRSEGIPCTHMVDDWMTTGKSEKEACRNLEAIKAKLESVGLSMSVEKEEVGKRLVFLGVLLDTEKMVLSFDSNNAKATRMQLEECMEIIHTGGMVDVTSVRSVAGKLNWYSEVLQEGRVHIRSWWTYLRYGRKLGKLAHTKLILDTQWWINILQSWEVDKLSGSEYPILSASELLTNDWMIHVLQSDASGTDGFGYLEGALNEVDPRYYSAAWDSDQNRTFESSHHGELKPLEHFIQHTNISHRMLVWISDSQSAVWSINKGRCFEEQGLTTLTNILHTCDVKKILLVGLWVPRDLNQAADYLSHLSRYLHRAECTGRAGELEALATYPDFTTSEEHPSSGTTKSNRLPRVVQGNGAKAVPRELPAHRRIPLSARLEQQRVHTIRVSGTESPKSNVQKPQTRMVKLGQSERHQRCSSSATIRTLVNEQKEKTTSTANTFSHPITNGLINTARTVPGRLDYDCTRRTTSRQRTTVGPQSC